jgi:autotransporter-associated beta strand protein
VIGGFGSTRDHKDASPNFQAQNGLPIPILPVAFSEECPNSGVTKTGGGTLVLSAGNTYGNGTTLNAGVLEVENPAALSSGALTVYDGQLELSGSTLNPLTISNAMMLTGVLQSQPSLNWAIT